MEIAKLNFFLMFKISLKLLKFCLLYNLDTYLEMSLVTTVLMVES